MTVSWKVSGYSPVLWGLAVGIILADAGYYFISISPKSRIASRLEREYQQKRKSRSQQSPSVSGDTAGLKEIYAALPSWDEFTKVAGEIYSRAEKMGLEIDSASYKSNTPEGSELVRVKVSMPVKGTYGSIKRFIYDLETSSRMHSIQELSLGSGKAEEGEVSLNLTIVMHFKG